MENNEKSAWELSKSSSEMAAVQELEEEDYSDENSNNSSMRSPYRSRPLAAYFSLLSSLLLFVAQLQMIKGWAAPKMLHGLRRSRAAYSMASEASSSSSLQHQLSVVAAQDKLLKRFPSSSSTCTVYTAVSFFKFAPPHTLLPPPAAVQQDSLLSSPQLLQSLKRSLQALNVTGTLTISTQEGYNAAFAVPTHSLTEFHSTLLSADSRLFADLDLNIGQTTDYAGRREFFPFKKLIVKIKPTVLTDGMHRRAVGATTDAGAAAAAAATGDGGDSAASNDSGGDSNDVDSNDSDGSTRSLVVDFTDAGEEIEPAQWHHELLHQTDTDNPPLLIDCRNGYESSLGSFQGAIPLNTSVFSQSWDRLDSLLQDVPKDRRVLTFCTGGIRCIKVNAYLKQRLGLTNVARLRKGIIHYEGWAGEEEGEGEEGEGGGEETEGGDQSGAAGASGAGAMEGEDEGEGAKGASKGINSSSSSGSSSSSSSSKRTSLFRGENFLFDRRRLERERAGEGQQ